MAEVTIEIPELDALLRKFGASNRIVQSAVKGAIQKSVYHLQSKVATYPPPPPMSTYRRTGTLGRSWTTKIEGSGREIRGIVGNAIPYAPFVQGPDQAWMHVGRWKTIGQVAEEETAKVREFFAGATKKVVEDLAK